VDIRIGVTDNPQPIVLQLADDTDRDDLKARIDTAISGGEGVLWLTDDKGKESPFRRPGSPSSNSVRPAATRSGSADRLIG